MPRQSPMGSGARPAAETRGRLLSDHATDRVAQGYRISSVDEARARRLLERRGERPVFRAVGPANRGDPA